jgi:hypothetical protein
MIACTLVTTMYTPPWVGVRFFPLAPYTTRVPLLSLFPCTRAHAPLSHIYGRSSRKQKLGEDRTVRPVGKRAAGVFSGDSPSHASQSLSFLAACRHFGGALGSERHLAQREDLRLPCGQRELPGQLPSLQSYLLRPCSHTWLPLHPSRLHLHLLMPCGLQRPLPQRSLPHLQNCSCFQERGQ